MKKMYVLLAALLFLFSGTVFLPAVAAVKNAHDEIIYRTNLGRADDVRMLLHNGASPDETNSAGVPLLALAASRRDSEGIDVVKVLLDAGAHIDARDPAGQSALFYAVKQGNKDIVNYLLSKGADYYATDNSGNTARNIAYSTGKTEIGVAIDDFIKEQTAERAKQYEDYNHIVAERLEAQKEAAMRALAPPPAPAPPPPKTEAPPVQTPPPPPPPKAHVLTAEEQAAQQAAQQKRRDEIKRLENDLAFNTCAFQYWSYVSDSKVTSELTGDELDNTIDSYQGKASALEDQLANAYHVHAQAVKSVSGRAEQSIFRQLSAMPSNSYRFEHGVGKVSDMQSRCKEVSRRWDRELPQPQPQPVEKTGGGSIIRTFPGASPGQMPHAGTLR